MPAAGGDVFLPGRTSVVGKGGGGRKIMGMNPWVLAGAVGGGILLYFLYKRYKNNQASQDQNATTTDTTGGTTDGGGSSGLTPTNGDFGQPPPDLGLPVPIDIVLPPLDIQPFIDWWNSLHPDPTKTSPDGQDITPTVTKYDLGGQTAPQKLAASVLGLGTGSPQSILGSHVAPPSPPIGRTVTQPPKVTVTGGGYQGGPWGALGYGPPAPPARTTQSVPVTRQTVQSPPSYDSRTPINVNVNPVSRYIPASVPHGGGLGGPK